MSNNQEIIEARLAAYVDSDLDAQERAEIERHLEQHPEHRRLLDELRKGREVLRGLPREAAPPELAEAFNGQLERAVLLDGAGNYEEPRMRVGRWPQVFAVAAIFFLTLGLAGVVYFALPNHKSYQVASNAPAPKPSLPVPPPITDRRPDAGPAEDAEVSKDKNAGEQPKPDADRMAQGSFGKGGVNLESKNGMATNANPEQHDDLKALAENVSQVRQVQDLLSNNTGRAENFQPSLDEALVLAVRSNDPGQTEKELANYLDPNKITWQRAPGQVPAALNSSLALQSGNSALAETPAQEPNSAPGNSTEADKQQSSYSKKEEEVAAQGKRTDAAKAVGGGGGAAQAIDGAEDRKFAGGDSAASKPAIDPSAMPKVSDSQVARPGAAPGKIHAPPSRETQLPASPDSQIAQAQQPSPAPRQALPAGQGGQASQQVAQGEPNPIDNLYVARRMSRRQAQELTDRLSRNGEVRRAEVVRRAGEGNNYNYALANNSASANNSVLGNNTTQFGSNSAQGPAGAAVMTPERAATREAGDRFREGIADNYNAREKMADFERLNKAGKTRDETPSALTAAGANTRPLDEVVKKGDSLTLHYRQLAAGTTEAADESEVVRVKDDGTIMPRGLAGSKASAVAVAGKTVSEVEKSLQKYEAGPATMPAAALATARHAVTVERLSQGVNDAPSPAASPAAPPSSDKPVADKVPANGPETPPAGQPSRAFGGRSMPAGLPTTQPTNLAAAVAPPATQPAGAAADDQVDVVIVVQKDTTPTPSGSAPPGNNAASAPSLAPAGNAPGEPAPATQPVGPTPAPSK